MIINRFYSSAVKTPYFLKSSFWDMARRLFPDENHQREASKREQNEYLLGASTSKTLLIDA